MTKNSKEKWTKRYDEDKRFSIRSGNLLFYNQQFFYSVYFIKILSNENKIKNDRKLRTGYSGTYHYASWSWFYFNNKPLT